MLSIRSSLIIIALLFNITSLAFADTSVLDVAVQGIKLQTTRTAAGEYTITIQSSAAEKSEVLALEKPSRIVVDLLGATIQKNQNITSKDSQLKSVRLGRHPEKVRIVFDLSGDEMPSIRSSIQAGLLTISYQASHTSQSTEKDDAVISTPTITPAYEQQATPATPPRVETAPRAKITAISADAPHMFNAEETRIAELSPVVEATSAPTKTATRTPSPTPTETAPQKATTPVIPTLVSTPLPTHTPSVEPLDTLLKEELTVPTKTELPALSPTSESKIIEATVTNTAAPKNTEKPTKTATLTATPTATRTPQPTATPVPPSPTPTVAPTKTPTRAPTPTPTVDLIESLTKEEPLKDSSGKKLAPIVPSKELGNDKEQILTEIKFDYQIQNRAPLLRLILAQSSNFNLVKKDTKSYELVLPDCGIRESSLALPFFPPHDFVGFNLVYPRYQNGSTVITLGIDRGLRVTAFARGNEIWVKAGNK